MTKLFVKDLESIVQMAGTFVIDLQGYHFEVSFTNTITDSGTFLQEVYGRWCSLSDKDNGIINRLPLIESYHTIASSDEYPPITAKKAQRVVNTMYLEISRLKSKITPASPFII